MNNELFGAIKRGNRKILASLIASGRNLEEVNEDGDTPLLYAIRLQRHLLIPLLLEAGADPNHAVRLPATFERRERGKHTMTESPLSLATVMSDRAAVELLLQRGARVHDSNVEAAACLALFYGGKRARLTVLRLLDAGLNPKSSWKGMRLYRIAERNKEVLAKLKFLGETMRPRKERRSRRQACPQADTDLVSFIHDWGHPEWVVLAVEAPVDQVSSLYAAACAAKARLTNVPVRPARKEDEEMAPVIPIVQPRGSVWSVILRVICLPIGESDIRGAETACQNLSAKLRTRALAFFGEKTSFAMSYRLFQQGKKIVSRDWNSQLDSAESEFAALGIYLPACYPMREGAKTWVCAREASIDRIQRADIVDLGEI